MKIEFSISGSLIQAMVIDRGQPITGRGKGIEEAVKNLMLNVEEYKEKYNTKVGETPKRYLVEDRED